MPRQAKKPPERDDKFAIISVRLPPRLKYGAELAARAQHNSVSGFAEWAIANALRQISSMSRDGEDCTIEEIISQTYRLTRSDRLILLARAFPALLTYDEEAMLTFAHRCEGLKSPQGKLKASLLERHWDAIEQVAVGEKAFESLPKKLRDG